MKSRNNKEYSYTFAGVKIQTNKLVNELPIDGFSDINLKILFKKQKYFQINKNDSTDDSFLNVPKINDSHSCISNDGKTSIIIESSTKYMDYAFEIRNVLPYSSIMQNKLILHASAILYKKKVFAFLGESGAGKSTIANELECFGYKVVTDDLLPCRMIDSEVRVPVHHNSKTKTFPLDSIFFINRDRNINSIVINNLRGVNLFNLLMSNGYGNLKSLLLWRNQFNLYGKIVKRVKAFNLFIPDNKKLIKRNLSIFISQTFYYG